MRETELTGQEVYDIYQRLRQTQDAEHLPATLEGIWGVLSASESLSARGCVQFGAPTGEPLLRIQGVPGVADGAVLTVDRGL